MSIPYNAQPSRKHFRIPKSLPDDFKNFLNHDIPGAVMDFVILRSWYEQFEEDYVERTERGEIYEDSTKSRYTNMDNVGLNLRFAWDADVINGDYVIDTDGTIYLLDWKMAPSPNNKNTRPLRCNLKTSFKRFIGDSYMSNQDTGIMEQIIDPDTGMVIQPQPVDPDDAPEVEILIDENGYQTIAEEIPCNAYRYDGRPEYASVYGSAGISPNALTMMSIQYNQQTKNIRTNDQFVWNNEVYIVIDINPVDINLGGQTGILSLQCKRKAGGYIG